MEILYDFAKFSVQLVTFFFVAILAFVVYEFVADLIRRWWLGDDYYGKISPELRAFLDSEKDKRGGCDEGECEWPCACDDVAVRKDRFYKELDAMAEAKEKAEQEFWERREVLVELWEPKEGGGETHN